MNLDFKSTIFLCAFNNFTNNEFISSINVLSKKLDLIVKNEVDLKIPTKDYEYFKIFS
jgi:hypothetical protein